MDLSYAVYSADTEKELLEKLGRRVGAGYLSHDPFFCFLTKKWLAVVKIVD